LLVELLPNSNFNISLTTFSLIPYFKLIFLISYVVIFGVALLTIALPASQKSWLFGSSDSASFFKSVESGVYSFMSYLN